MKNLILIMLLMFASFANAEVELCEKWSYSNLQVNSNATLDGKKVTGVHTFIMWESDSEFGIWNDNDPLPTGIQKKLTAFFGINTVHPFGIVNKIGAAGWEAFSVQTVSLAGTEKATEWHFKKCIK